MSRYQIAQHGFMWRPEPSTDNLNCPECDDVKYEVRPVQDPDDYTKRTYMFACLECGCVFTVLDENGRPIPVSEEAIPLVEPEEMPDACPDCEAKRRVDPACTLCGGKGVLPRADA